MNTINDFSKEQIDLFRRVCDDAMGPTCATELLLLIEGVIGALDDGEGGYKNYGEMSEKIDACLAALSFVRATEILERK